MPVVTHRFFPTALLTLLIFAWCGALRASHFVGGELRYKCLGGNYYTLELRLFRDCSSPSNAQMPISAYIEVYKGNGSMVGSFQCSRNTPSLLNISRPACANVPPNFCVETALFTVDSVFLAPSTSGYKFYWDQCCRNANISNVNGASTKGMAVTSSTTAVSPCNNSPYFNHNPPLVIPFNIPLNINASAIDPDGDSLYYELCQPLDDKPSSPPFDTITFSGNNHSKYPIPSSPPFSIDPNTGIITGTVSQVGNYLVAICVREYRNGVYIGSIQRDYQFNAIQAWTLFASIPIDSVVEPTCKGYSDGRIALVVAGGKPPLTYQWSNNATTSSIGNLTAGTYSVVVTDSNSCSDTVVVTLNQPSGMSMTVVNTTPESCPGVIDGGAQVSISGGTSPYNIMWDSGTPGSQASQLASGKHSLYVTDSAGCRDTFEIVIPELNALKIVVDTVKHVNCLGGNDGFIQVRALNNIGAVQFSWSDGQSTSIASNLAAGAYTVTVNDSKGCTDDTTIVITEPTLLQAQIDSVQNTSCQNVADGRVFISMAGGTPPYKISTPVGVVKGQKVEKISQGQHSITVIDSNGCKKVLQTTIGQNDPLAFTSLEVLSPTCYNIYDGFAQPEVIGGQKPYTFYWSNGNVGTYQDSLRPGWYEVSVVDKHGCNLDTTFHVAPLTTPVLEIEEIRSTCMQIADAELHLNVSGPPKNYDFYVDSIPLSLLNGELLAGLHHIMAVDEDGCILSEDFRIHSRMERIIFFPTAFTPNGDGLNDELVIVGDERCFTNPSFKVFNRWGEIVFSSYNPFNEAWNGFVESSPAKEDTYIYKFTSDHFSAEGYFTLIY